MNVKQILFYTRPWEDDFHLEMARQLQEIYPWIPIRFVTFFISSFRKAKAEGYDGVYFPDELRKVSGDEISAERFAEIDQLLYETGGANFNLMLHSERFLPKDAVDAELFGKKHLAVLSRLVKDGTLSVSSMYDHFVYWLAGGLANARNGWHFSFVGCGTPANRTLALKTPWETWMRPGILPEDAARLMESSREALSIPPAERISYMKPQRRRKKSLKERWKWYSEIRYDKMAGSYFYDGFITPAQWLCEKILPVKLYRKTFFYPEPVYAVNTTEEVGRIKDKYVYLPLHLEPEAVILMYSPWLRDQAEVVRLAAQALPAGWKLLVKENPKMAGLRTPEFNQRVMAMPNVRIVAPSVSSTELMKRAESVIVLAGTSAIEARLVAKSAFCLGVPPFRRVLSGGDIAGGVFALSNLFEKFQELHPSLIDKERWQEWIAGTVGGNAVPVNGTTDSSAENVKFFSEFIAQCISAK